MLRPVELEKSCHAGQWRTAVANTVNYGHEADPSMCFSRRRLAGEDAPEEKKEAGKKTCQNH